jgi:hypothetical protein
MIQHAWTLACNKCIVDPSTNNATLVEVFEQLNIEGPVEFPAVAPMQLDVVSVWYRSVPEQGTRGSGRCSLVGPTGSVSGKSVEYAIDLMTYFRGRTIARISGLSLSGPGLYFFKVELRTDPGQAWHEVAKVPLNVVLGATAVVAPPGPAV